MELYNEEFVYFDWDDKLDGKKGFVAQNIASLKSQVNDGPKTMVTLSGSDDDVCPFTYFCDGEITCDYQFAYYDPYYELRKAYLEGKQLQFKNVNGEWIAVDGAPLFTNDEYRVKPEYRIKPEVNWNIYLTECESGIFFEITMECKTDSHCYFSGSEESCHEWVARHSKFKNIMAAWEAGKDIEFKHKCDCGWSPATSPNWDETLEYRVKGKDVPFDTLDELIHKWEGMNPGCTNRPKCAMPMIWVKSKSTKRIYLIDAYDYEDNEVGLCDSWFTLKELFEDYTFINDSIIGKKG